MRETFNTKPPIEIGTVSIPEILNALKGYESVLGDPDVVQREKKKEEARQK
jgi:hypothetical protein